MKTIQRLLGSLALISSAYLGLGLENKSHAVTLNIPSQYSSIQSAVNASHDGDEIIVSPRRYLENVSITGRGIKIRSVNPLDENIVKSTIIDGQTSNSVITLRDNINSTATLEGLTITNGKAQYGGGINAKNSLLALSDCVVTSNSCLGGTDAAGGGGIYCENSTTTLKNCNVSKNNVLGGTWRSQYKYIITGYGKSGDGGGVYLLSSKTAITDCEITSNTIKSGDANVGGYVHFGYCDPSRGSGICFVDSSLIILNSVIEKNISTGGNILNDRFIDQAQAGNATGGGVCSISSLSIISNSVINKNRSVGGNAAGHNAVDAFGGDAFGGGISYESSHSLISNCIINDNSALGGSIGEYIIYKRKIGDGVGGGIYDLDSSVSLINSTIVDNNIFKGTGQPSPGYEGIETGGGLYGDFQTIKNTILWNNRVNQIDGVTSSTQPLYCDIQDWSGGEGNISLDPQFVNAENGDFHLKSTSPCVDAGIRIENLLTDIEGNFRPQGKAFDIGAYEYNPSKSAISYKTWEMYE